MVVIAEYGPNSLRRIQRREGFGARLDESTVRSRVIAGEHEHVWLRSLSDVDNVTDFIDAENAAVMNVGQLREAKVFEAPGKVADEDVCFGDPVVIWFDEARV